MMGYIMCFIFGAALGYGAAVVAVVLEDYNEYKK